VSRLFLCIAFTSEMEGMRKFYRDTVGLGVVTDGPFFAQFEGEPEGASPAVLAVSPGQPREIELCFETPDLEADVAVLRGRGVRFVDEIRRQEFGKVIHFRDPEGNLFSMLEPSVSVAGSRAAGASAERGEAPSGSTAVAVSAAPVLAHAIVNARDVSALKTFFREKLGLRVRSDSETWVEFETGGTSLAIRPAGAQTAAEPRGLALGFVVGDLIAWSDPARERGLHFASAPEDEGSGPAAAAIDPEGNEITFREPPAAPVLEEELALSFDDDRIPHQVAIRTPVKKGVKAVSRVAIRPEYKTEAPGKASKKKPRKPAASTVGLRSTRGAGPERTRLEPKRKADPKRAGTRPATGRLKKAERRTLETKKTSVAVASKGKPLKRAAAKRGRKR
jgi:catechol 2,3-dioxygenase-like lactoylglutathione lyase family enzyme